VDSLPEKQRLEELGGLLVWFDGSRGRQNGGRRGLEPEQDVLSGCRGVITDKGTLTCLAGKQMLALVFNDEDATVVELA
jgi:hypothetical protein